MPLQSHEILDICDFWLTWVPASNVYCRNMWIGSLCAVLLIAGLLLQPLHTTPPLTSAQMSVAPKPHAPCGWGQIVLVKDATENQGRGGGMMREYNIRLGAYWPTVGSGGRPGHMAEGEEGGVVGGGRGWRLGDNEMEWRGGVGVGV